ncbi:hypothetical protein EYF80_009167 [Liparis tanakae]|uniref:Uncharacterized protein n=1 Tax=Liparis tanakae TaxID=230148 RepID=A0A4Z2IRM5_9TELE|nr:hypothetical protein EYF80_009167 [Liparis tanakae]
MAYLFDPLASLTNDGASQLSEGDREEHEGGRQGRRNKLAEKHFKHWEYTSQMNGRRIVNPDSGSEREELRDIPLRPTAVWD